jgi:uncharacterized protein YgiM (DUF1202 family)
MLIAILDMIASLERKRCMNTRTLLPIAIVFVALACAFFLVGDALAAHEHAPVLSNSAAISDLAAKAYYDEPNAVVWTGALNVRTGPDVAYQSTAVVYSGQVVWLVGRSGVNSWVKVRLYSGHEGWVNSYYLNMSVPISSLPVVSGPAPTPPISPTQPVATPNTAVVATGALNVRSGPGIAYGVVTVVTQGQSLQLLGRNASNSWVQVRTPSGHVGWVNATLIYSTVPIYSLPIVSGTPTTPSTPTSPVGVVNTGAANVRSGPGTTYTVIAVVTRGQQVALLGRNADISWARVRVGDGTTGWLNASLIQSNVPISSLPIVQDAPATPTAVISVGALNVRYGPGTGFGVITVVFRGQNVALVGRNSSATWVQVRLSNGTVGWVNANYVVGNVPVSSLPITY